VSRALVTGRRFANVKSEKSRFSAPCCWETKGYRRPKGPAETESGMLGLRQEERVRDEARSKRDVCLHNGRIEVTKGEESWGNKKPLRRKSFQKKKEAHGEKDCSAPWHEIANAAEKHEKRTPKRRRVPYGKRNDLIADYYKIEKKKENSLEEEGLWHPQEKKGIIEEKEERERRSINERRFDGTSGDHNKSHLRFHASGK